MQIKLNFINRSSATNNPRLAIFQQSNGGASGEPGALAWRMIGSRAIDDPGPFLLPLQAQAGGLGADYPPQLGAAARNMDLEMDMDMDAILRRNRDAIEAAEARGNRQAEPGNASLDSNAMAPVATTTAEPLQDAVSASAPTIRISAVSAMPAGEAMAPAPLSPVDTELSLLGIASADVVITGGGCGPSSTPISFHLENIVRL